LKLLVNEALCERELDLEIADVLSARETLTIPSISIVVAPTVTVTAVSGVAIAVQVLSDQSSNVAAALTYVHG